MSYREIARNPHAEADAEQFVKNVARAQEIRLRAMGITCAPHDFKRRGWRFWICTHCYAPKSLHPRTKYVRARPLNDNHYISPDAPHFNEPGW